MSPPLCSFLPLPQHGPSFSSPFFQAACAEATTQQHRAAVGARDAAAAASERADAERARAEREAARAERAEMARDTLTAMLSSANDARAAELSRADDELADSNALQVCPRLLAFVRSRRRVVERKGPQKEALP